MLKKNAADQVNQLIDIGKEKGFLTYEEINEVLPSDVVSPDQLDDLIIMFGEMDIEIVDNTIYSHDDILKEVDLIMPIKGYRFNISLMKPGDPEYTQGPITEKDNGFTIDVRVVTYHEPNEEGIQFIKDVRDQEVFFISKQVLPIKGFRLRNYLKALEYYISNQSFENMEKYFPHVFFFSELLRDSSA